MSQLSIIIRTKKIIGKNLFRESRKERQWF